MTINLSPQLEKLVRQKVESGEYSSADALVGEAVQRLVDEDQDEDAHQEEICARIDAAEAEVDRGEYVEYDEKTVRELAKDVHERGLKKLASERGKTRTRG